MHTLQHRNKSVIRSWEGKAGRKAGSFRESLLGRRIWPWKVVQVATAGQGLAGDITKHPQPWSGSSPSIPTQDGGKNIQGFAHALFWCFLAFLFQLGTNPSLTSLQSFRPHPRTCVQGRGWQGSSTLMLPAHL